MTRLSPATGFGLIDLIASIAVLGITLAIALPAYARMIDEGHATRAANHFHAVLSIARVHAVQRGIRVTVCRSRDGQRCLYAGAWSAGSIVFEDRNRDNDRSPDERIIDVFDPTDAAPFHVVGPHNRTIIGFNPDGRSAGTNLTLRICDPSLDVVRLVVVSVSGRPRTSRDVPRGARCGADPNPPA
jgi:type IV fimbrial biogenesis protein FimT